MGYLPALPAASTCRTTNWHIYWPWALFPPSPSLTQVIKSEFCASCGRKTRFGKMYLRCQDCRVVSHPECRDRCPMPCNPTAVSTPINNAEVQLSHCLMTCFHSIIFHYFLLLSRCLHRKWCILYAGHPGGLRSSDISQNPSIGYLLH